ncbi:MAG: DEAD/DEAH box helicase, partial [Candidatus Neomarinimicrobiota bacterium]
MRPEQFPDLVKLLLAHPLLGPNFVHVRHIPGNAGEFVDFPDSVDERLRRAYRSRGVERLYSHQAAVWNNLRAGNNVTVVTPTASGKTLCYNLPVLQMVLDDPGA